MVEKDATTTSDDEFEYVTYYFCCAKCGEKLKRKYARAVALSATLDRMLKKKAE
jgi:YHS domain-containing protein